MANFAFKALDLAGVPTRGEIEAEDKQAVSTQLRGKGLIVLDIEELKPANAGDLLANFKQVKSADLTIATRQLSTMISSGMSLLRALYVLEEQTDNDKLKDAWIAVRKDVEAGLAFSEALGAAPRRSSTTSTWPWWPRARPAASWRRRSSAWPTSSSRTTRCAARSRPRWSTRR